MNIYSIEDKPFVLRCSMKLMMQYESYDDACYCIGQLYSAFKVGNFPCKVCRPSHHHQHTTISPPNFADETFLW